MKTVVQNHSENFNTLTDAFNNNEVCLMECIEKLTGEKIAVICGVWFNPKSNEYEFTPFAKFFNGNPYELLEPPE